MRELIKYIKKREENILQYITHIKFATLLKLKEKKKEKNNIF